MKRYLILLFLIHSILAIGQKEVKYCEFDKKEINIENINQFLEGFDSLMYTYKTEPLIEVINCLLKIDSTNPQIAFYKALLGQRINSQTPENQDTSFIDYYRKCIEYNYNAEDAYYNISVFYVNKALHNYNDTLSKSLNERIRLLKIAENTAWESLIKHHRYTYFLLGQIQNYYNKLVSKGPNKIYFNDDTIKLITHINDCGEFGGHFETLTFSKKNGMYYSSFYSDSVFCQGDSVRPSMNSKYNGLEKQVELNDFKDLVKQIETYEQDMSYLTNAPIEIMLIQNKKTVYKRIDKKWNYYLDFRQKVFGF